MTTNPLPDVGTLVKCKLPGKRTFKSIVVATREADGAVDVLDPRNNGLRTLPLEYITVPPVRRRRAS